jgi:hypothetical protein
MTIQFIQCTLAMLARQAARAAKHDSKLNDAADALYAICVQLKVPVVMLPL